MMLSLQLDETGCDIAYDSAADCDGTLMGAPVWQPDGGLAAGALQFDGEDDYVSSDPVLNPAIGPFSVVAWIVGGAPGQVILSQADGASGLCMDSVEGNGMTELTNSGRSYVGPMFSQASITDGDWHRIGFVWDGSYRHLYVDGVEVAGDVVPLSALKGSDGGLYLGAGSNLAPGTFFCSLIDDDRIYNRAVHPQWRCSLRKRVQELAT
ncbi:MAG: LamG domain-containing protein [Phycisphaerales bacterium]|nr:MAG: LamG domain-containing protein [Phycisphaerales bacterium]